MNKHLKRLLIVIPVCFLLAGAALLSCLLDAERDTGKTVGYVILILWAFFLVPAYVYTAIWAKGYFERLNMAQAFCLGYVWGGLAFILPLICAPILGILWIADEIIALHNRNNGGNIEY